MKTVVDTCVRGGGRKIIEGEENILAGKKVVQPRNILAVGKKIGLRKKLGCGKNWAAEKMGLRKFFWAPHAFTKSWLQHCVLFYVMLLDDHRSLDSTVREIVGSLLDESHIFVCC